MKDIAIRAIITYTADALHPYMNHSLDNHNPSELSETATTLMHLWKFYIHPSAIPEKLQQVRALRNVLLLSTMFVRWMCKACHVPLM
jgi:CxxC motif-containing protein (DUF1111 family)